MGMNLVMAVVAIFVLSGEVKIARLESANITQCLTEMLTVENFLEQIGAEDVEVKCEIRVEREPTT